MLYEDVNDKFAQALNRLNEARPDQAIDALYGLCLTINELDALSAAAVYQAIDVWLGGCFPFSKHYRAAKRLQHALMARMRYLTNTIPRTVGEKQNLVSFFQTVTKGRIVRV